MNKQLTKKTIGIAASAALMAAALSTTAVAGPPANKGPKASITVAAWCDVEPRNLTDATLVVNTLVTDAGGEVSAEITDSSITPVQGVGNNKRGDKFMPLEGATIAGPSLIGDVETVEIDLCAAGMSSAANAANAMVSVEIVGGHKIFTAMCSDHDLDGDGYPDVFSNVKIGGWGLCPQN
jgi:hypothetical protein